MNDVLVTKQSGLGRREPSEDGVSGLLANGVAVVGGAQLGIVYRLKGVADAVALKIDPAYDTDNSVLVYEHINEYFRQNTNDLYLMLVAQNVAFADMVDKANATNAMKLRNEAEGKIKQLAVAYNPAVAVVDTTDLSAAIPKAQEFAVQCFNDHMPLEIFLEGKGFDHAAPIDFRALNAENVTVVVGQSLSVANVDATYAAVGAFLGSVSKANVNECVAWVEKFNLLGGSLAVPAISGDAVRTLSLATLDALHEDGAVFYRTLTGKAGIYWNDSHTSTEATSDFAYVESNRTIHKASRNIRTAILPKLNSPVLIDAEAGTLDPVTVSVLEDLARNELKLMAANGEISTPRQDDVYIDPTQDVLGTSEITIEVKMVPTGTARKISINLGFDNPVTA